MGMQNGDFILYVQCTYQYFPQAGEQWDSPGNFGSNFHTHDS